VDHPDRAYFLTSIAECELNLGRPKDALPKLEQALATRERVPQLAGQTPRTRFVLARALVATKGDRKRAEKLLATAEEEFRAAGPAYSRWLDQLTAWRSREW
jgi:hypothetical protein